MKYVLMAGIAACLCGIAVADDTESPSASAGQTFTPEDFDQFAPRTALDMVQQIPGFSIEEDGATTAADLGIELPDVPAAGTNAE